MLCLAEIGAVIADQHVRMPGTVVSHLLILFTGHLMVLEFVYILQTLSCTHDVLHYYALYISMVCSLDVCR